MYLCLVCIRSWWERRQYVRCQNLHVFLSGLFQILRILNLNIHVFLVWSVSNLENLEPESSCIFVLCVSDFEMPEYYVMYFHLVSVSDLENEMPEYYEMYFHLVSVSDLENEMPEYYEMYFYLVCFRSLWERSEYIIMYFRLVCFRSWWKRSEYCVMYFRLVCFRSWWERRQDVIRVCVTVDTQ